MDTLSRLTEIFRSVAGSDALPAAITPETHLFQDLKLNSIAMLYMALAIEEEFGVTFSNQDFPKLATVADVIAYLES